MTTLACEGGRVLVDSMWVDGPIAIEGSRIASVGHIVTDSCTRRIDATGCSIVPGFIDLQVNGALGVDLTSEPTRVGEVAEYLVKCGVTSFMPTVISSSRATAATALTAISGWSHAGKRAARSLGVHLEGPFLNPARAGAHPPHRLRPPSVDDARHWHSEHGVAMVTLAPELRGALDVIGELAGHGVTVCAGHTEAGDVELAAAIRAGLRGVTHLFNAMTPMSARNPGPAGATIADPALIAGLIVDGLHVDRAMVRLAWRALGPSRIALVSDAVAALGMGFGPYRIGDTDVVVDETGVRTAQGVLAGSALRLDEAVRNLMAFTGCSLIDASTSASATPARLAQRAELGRLVPGSAADLVLLDEAKTVVATVVDGCVVFDAQQRCSAA
ncbi:MAG TPA: N-acetylglucosamine-6-phosphate deacetylase [Ilumatobacteraceae bacterium]|nr:N-acetylglucosamine-6-phosphate deacetylase [Ilumatobacteraceae bacterium]